eukprot:Skav205844  [mRNA]  locus=scaffold160:512020:513123:+ [translate_table: standard]
MRLPFKVPLASVKQFGPQELSNTAWALATLMQDNQQLLSAMEERFHQVLDVGKAQELASMSWAFATLEHRAEPLLLAMAQRLLEVKELEARHLSTTAWTFGTLALLDAPLMVRMAQASLERDDLGPQAISNILWSFATLQVLHYPVMQSMAGSALNQLTQFGSQELSNLAWSCATLAYANLPLLDALLTTVVGLTLRPLELSNTIWAFATLQVGDAAQFARMVLPQLEGLPPEGLATSAWALVELRYTGRVLDAMAETAKEQVTSFAQEEFRMLLWALAHGAPQSAVSLLHHGEAQGRRFTAQCLSSLIAEAEQRELHHLEVQLLQRLGGSSCSPAPALKELATAEARRCEAQNRWAFWCVEEVDDG